VLLRLDKVQEAKHGTAVIRERARHESPILHHKKPNDICYSVFYFARVGFKLNNPFDKLYFKSFSLCHSELVSESNQLSVYTIYW